MFEAFQNNGRPWVRMQQTKTHCGGGWWGCLIILLSRYVSGSENLMRQCELILELPNKNSSHTIIYV